MAYLMEVLPNKGLNTSAPAEFISSGTIPEVLNMQVVRNIVQKIYGTKMFQNADISGENKEIMAVVEFKKEEVNYLIRIGRNKVERYNSNSKVWIDATGDTDLTGSIDNVISYAIAFDIDGLPVLVFTNGIDAIKVYDTAADKIKSLGGTTQKAKYVCAFGAYLILANINNGVTQLGNQILWSDTGNIEEWTDGNAGGQMLIDENNDEEITGIGTFGQYLAVHKEKSIYLGALLSSSDVFSFEKTATGVGTCCHNTIRTLNTGGQIFLAKDGLRMFNGTSAPLIDSPMQEDIRASLNPEKYHRCWSIVVPESDEYWVGIPLGNDEGPYTVYKYNYVLGTIFKDQRIGVNCAGYFTSDNSVMIQDINIPMNEANFPFDNLKLLALHKKVVFGRVDGKTTIIDSTVNDDVDTVIPTVFETRDYYTDSAKMARWIKLTVWAKGDSLTLNCSLDKGLTWESGQTIKLDAEFPKPTSPKIFYFDYVSDTIRFKFSNSSKGEKWALKQFQVEVIGREAIK